MTRDRLGPFLLKRPIGYGGMAVVYDAIDERTDAACVVKLQNRMVIEETLTRRFEREASLGMAIDNPHVVRIHGLGNEEGVPYIVMERVDGITLDAWILRHGRPDVPTTIGFIRQALLGLQAMSEAGVMHRDLKPENLMISDDGHLTIIDLGLARTPVDEAITAEGMAPGTVGYIAPEMLDSAHPPDHRCDQFSLGVIAYLMLAARLPFPDQSVDDYLAEIRLGAPPLALVNRDIPQELAAVVHRMLQASPLRRYPAPYACLRELEQAQIAVSGGPRRSVNPTPLPVTESHGDPKRDFPRVSRVIADMRLALSHQDLDLCQTVLQRAKALRAMVTDRHARRLLDHYLWIWRSEIRWMRLQRILAWRPFRN